MLWHQHTEKKLNSAGILPLSFKKKYCFQFMYFHHLWTSKFYATWLERTRQNNQWNTSRKCSSTNTPLSFSGKLWIYSLLRINGFCTGLLTGIHWGQTQTVDDHFLSLVCGLWDTAVWQYIEVVKMYLWQGGGRQRRVDSHSQVHCLLFLIADRRPKKFVFHAWRI